MGVSVGILGPLEVHVDGEAVDLGAPKQRAVLAYLAAHAGRPVALDRLIEELWGDQAPPRATASLQAYVSNLRRVLEPDRPPRSPAHVLVSRPPGYALVLADGTDADRFEALLARAGAAAAAGDVHDALATVDEALALWRGEPLADFPYDHFADPVREHLNGRRLEAERLRADLLLAAGRPREAATALGPLTDAHPLDEGLWERRMLAEYRSGRQADALRSFQAARTVLTDQLGLDPGPALRNLEDRILAQDPGLDGPVAPAPGARAAPAGAVASGPPTAPADSPADLPTATDPGGSADAAHGGTAAATEPVVDPGAAEPPAALVGRDAELDALTGALDRSARGEVTFALVTGEPGIGKTTLVEALTAGATGPVVWGRSFDQAGSAALWPWAQVVRSLLGDDPAAEAGELLGGLRAGALAPLLPELGLTRGGADDPDADRLRLFDTVRRLLGAVADRDGAPVVVVLEDVHWADGDSLRLLDFLAVELHHAPVLLVLTYRDEEAGPGSDLSAVLAGLARRGDVVRVPLAGLDAAAIARWAAVLVGAELDGGTAAAVEARTSGNPFFAGELIRLLDAERRLSPGDTSAMPIPAGVRDVVRRRVDRLPDNTRAVMRLAAVTGRDFPLDVLAVAVGLSDDALDDALEPAVLAGLVVESPTDPASLRFSHALVRDALAEDLPVIRRRRLHVRVAAAYEQVHAGRLDPHLTALAHHYGEAAALGHAAQAATYAAAAARRAAAAGAPIEAARLWQRALDASLLDPDMDPTALVDMRIELARALLRLGDIGGRAQAVEAVDAALALGDVERAVAAALAITSHDSTWIWAEFRTVPVEVNRRIEAVLEAVGPGDSAARARLLAVLAGGVYYADVDLAERHCTESLAMARRLGDLHVLRDAVVAQCVSKPPDLYAKARELGEVAAAIGDRTGMALAEVDMAFARLSEADLAGADAHAARAEVLLAERPVPVAALQLAYYPGLRATMEARWDDTAAAVERVVELNRHASLFGAVDIRQVQQLAEAARERGRLWEYEEILRELTTHPGHTIHNYLAIALIQAGRRDDAVAHLAEHGGVERPYGDWRRLIESAQTVEVGVALGDTDAVAVAIDWLRPAEGRLTLAGNIDCMGPVDTFLGWGEIAIGERAAGVAHLRSGLATAEALGSPPWAARAHLYLAVALADDDPDAARRHAEAALDLGERHGMAHWAADARNVLTGEPTRYC